MKAVLAVLSLAVAAAQAGLLAAPAAVVPGSVAHHASLDYSYAPTFIPKTLVAAPAPIAVHAPVVTKVFAAPAAHIVAAPRVLTAHTSFTAHSPAKVLAAPAPIAIAAPVARVAVAAPAHVLHGSVAHHASLEYAPAFEKTLVAAPAFEKTLIAAPAFGKTLVAAPAPIALHGHAQVLAAPAAINVGGGSSYVAANPGAVHTADLPGHHLGSHHVNLAPAPGTI